jgi:hypothetical protein
MPPLTRFPGRNQYAPIKSANLSLPYQTQPVKP